MDERFLTRNIQESKQKIGIAYFLECYCQISPLTLVARDRQRLSALAAESALANFSHVPVGKGPRVA
jgi:hypothetical protein